MADFLTKALQVQMKPIGLAFPKPKKLVKRPARGGRLFNTRFIKKSRKSQKRMGPPIVFDKSRGRSKVPKEKTRWQLIKILDGMVSDFVLTKICQGKCMRCGKQHEQYENKAGEKKWHNYGTSHFWARDYMGTRFDIDNLDGLCFLPCHSQKWEHDKNGLYRDYMIKKLGESKFELLEIRARAITKFSTVDIRLMINNFSQLYK